ncbi:MAG TPA: head GIN domain-containing protein [Acidimicrobiia bacterium]|nr:head GIN domain-containing protein [Acidimicrobiia bacterium]
MKRAAITLALLVVVGGCVDDESDTIEGSGTVATETRAVGEFDRISVEGFGRLDVEVGLQTSLSIAADDNVLPYLVTDVDGNTLRIRSREDTSFRNIEQPIFTISTPLLAGVSISGSGEATVAGLAADRFEVSISGSGDLTAADVQLVVLDVSISGSGNVRPSGVAETLSLSIAGSGHFRGADLVAAFADVDIGGSGNVVVHATESLDISIGGSGGVTYLGDPALTQSIGGSGDISRG